MGVYPHLSWTRRVRIWCQNCDFLETAHATLAHKEKTGHIWFTWHVSSLPTHKLTRRARIWSQFREKFDSARAMRTRATKSSEMVSTEQCNVRVCYYPLIRYEKLKSEVKIANFQEPCSVFLRGVQQDQELRTRSEHRESGILPSSSIGRAQIASQKSGILEIEHWTHADISNILIPVLLSGKRSSKEKWVDSEKCNKFFPYFHQLSTKTIFVFFYGKNGEIHSRKSVFELTDAEF